ncbi:MAG: iron-sulfur cluster assembly scaffold protein [Chloroflexota bacterium]|nr:iron-sulfur cluster assembly scaffold protein [Chloroflexota bacterium]
MTLLDDLFRENILDHSQHPRYRGLLDPADIDHEVNNPLCGDWLHLTLRIAADERIAAVGWDGDGCAISQASASMLGEILLGMSVEEARTLTKEMVFDLIGIALTPNRMKCALLSLEAVKVGLHGRGA